MAMEVVGKLVYVDELVTSRLTSKKTYLVLTFQVGLRRYKFMAFKGDYEVVAVRLGYTPQEVMGADPDQLISWMRCRTWYTFNLLLVRQPYHMLLGHYIVQEFTLVEKEKK